MSKSLDGAKPCPFCGGDEIRIYMVTDADGTAWWGVFCHDCYVEKKYIASEACALIEWNTRNE